MNRNRTIQAILCGLSLLGILPAQEAADFSFSKDILGTEEGLCSFYLDLDAIRLVEPGLGDLRIVDSAGAFQPYFTEDFELSVETGSREYGTVEIESGLSGEKGQERPFAVYQLLAPEKESLPGTEPFAVNMLSFKFSLEGSWSVEVLVEVRGDSGSWVSLCHDSLYSLEGVVKDSLVLDQARSFNFCRVSVLSGTAGVSPAGLLPRFDLSVERKRLFTRRFDIDIARRDFRDGVSSIGFDLPEGLPLCSLGFDAEGRFDRVFEIRRDDGSVLARERLSAAGEGDGVWSRQGIACDYRVMKEGELSLAVLDRDDEPLELRNFSAEYRTSALVFEAKAGSAYRILFGSPGAHRPVYDIESFSSTLSARPRKEATLGELKVIGTVKAGKPGFPAKRFFDLFIVLVALVLATAVVLLLRKQGPERKGEGK